MSVVERMTKGGPTGDTSDPIAPSSQTSRGLTISMSAEQWVVWIFGAAALPLALNEVNDLPEKWMRFAIVAVLYVVMLWLSPGTKFESIARKVTRPVIILLAVALTSLLFAAVPHTGTAWQVVVNAVIWAIAVVAALRLEDSSSRITLIGDYMNGLMALTSVLVAIAAVLGVLGAAILLIRGDWYSGVLVLLVAASLPVWWFSKATGTAALSLVLTGAAIALAPLEIMNRHPPISMVIAISATGLLQMAVGALIFRWGRSVKGRAPATTEPTPEHPIPPLVGGIHGPTNGFSTPPQDENNDQTARGAPDDDNQGDADGEENQDQTNGGV